MKPLIKNFKFLGVLLIFFIFINLFSVHAQKTDDEDEEEQQQQVINDKAKTIPTPKKSRILARTVDSTLFSSKECSNDISRYCSRSRKELSDLAVLQCIHNEVPDLSVIAKDCQHLLYEFKKNLTVNLKLDNSALQVCKEDLVRLTECQSVDNINGHLVSCLLDNKDNISVETCKSFLNSIAALVFSDYRLIYNFINDCEADIRRFKCGRLEKAGGDDNQDENATPSTELAPTQQGKTIECLAKKFQSLDSKCKKQIVRVSELQSDDFHLDRTLYFACRDDRERLCDRVSSGDGRVYKCLMKNKFNELMSKECQEQLTRRQQVIAEDVQADRSLIKACKRDILENNCRGELRGNSSDSIKLTGLMLCLEQASKDGANLNPTCKSELLEHRKMLMSDYQLNPLIVKNCQAEIGEHCGGGLERGGKTLHCLLSKAKASVAKKNADIRFSPQCLNELRVLVKVADASDDVRVDPNLQEACSSILTGPCKDVQPGQGRVIQCIMRFLGTNSMSDECEERLLEIQFFVARDWKLSPTLYKSCKEEAIKYCNAKSNWHDWSTDPDNGPLVLPCLYHHIHDSDDDEDDENSDAKISERCANEVKLVMNIRAKSIDLMPEIQDKCASDLAAYCSKSQVNVKGEELKCLQNFYPQLESECQKAIGELTKDENKDIRLDQILMNACMPTIDEFCSDKKEEKGELLECLIRQKNNPKMHEKCRIGIEHHQLLNLEDVSLNYKFAKVCKPEVKEHCANMKSKLDVVHCLSEIILNDTLLDVEQRVGDKCRQQVRFELFQLNENIKLDPKLASSCKDDIQSLCADVPKGKGQVLECLRSKSKELSDGCREKLFKRDKINLVDQNVDYALQTKCKNAIQQFCHVDSDEDVISCLRKHLLKPNLEVSCRQIVINRIIMQNKDARLNPSLWKACSKDVHTFCRAEFVSVENINEELNGKVLKCLKKEFVNDRLSNQCQVEVDQVMREAANVDYRLDPLITENCMKEVQELCTSYANDKKENCLRLMFQRQQISRDSRCFEEIRRIIIEGAADIFVDHELSQICSADLARFCSDVPPGSSQQLKCLLSIKSSKKNQISERCSEKLDSRSELWKMAQVSESISGINDIARIINESENRSYFFFVLFSLIAVIFVLGCICRPALSRNRRDKVK